VGTHSPHPLGTNQKLFNKILLKVNHNGLYFFVFTIALFDNLTYNIKMRKVAYCVIFVCIYVINIV